MKMKSKIKFIPYGAAKMRYLKTGAVSLSTKKKLQNFASS